MATYTARSNIEKFYRSKSKKNNLLKKFESASSKSRVEKILNKKNGLENFTNINGRIDDYDNTYSTSQLTNIDYSKFENHVFFDSAEAKTTYAFSNIINNFPYDSSSKDIENFIVLLDGYSNYILRNKIKSFKGRYSFDETFYIDVKDNKAIKNGKIDGKIKVLEKDTTFQFWITPGNVNKDYIVAQKMFISQGENEGFSIEVNNVDNEHCTIGLSLANKNQFYKTTAILKKNETYNVSFINTNELGKIKTEVYINAKKANSTSVGYVNLSSHTTEFKTTSLLIGAGNLYDSINYELSNCIIDDFLISGKRLLLKEIINNIEYGCDASDTAYALYRFNELPEDYGNKTAVIDSSGNKLHGFIYNVDQTVVDVNKLISIRIPSDNIIYEKFYYSLSLFPDIVDNINNYSELSSAGKSYDAYNPNLVFKLFPKYLFLEGSDSNNLENEYYNNTDIASDPANHYLVNLLLVWGRFFDNLKCFVDSLSDILDVDYDNINDEMHSSAIVKLAAKSMGYDFNEIFNSPTIEKLSGISLSHDKQESEKTIRDIQNVLWKRLLINTQDVLRSKGTIQGIKSAFNTFGIDYTKFINVDEYSSQNKINYNLMFNKKNKRINMLSYDRDIGKTIEFDALGYPTNSYVMELNVDNVCDFNIDCCWSVEFYTRFNKIKKEDYKSKQSLFRVGNNLNNDLLLNLVFETKNESKITDITLYIDLEGDGNISKITLADVDIFSSDTWYNSVYCKKLNDDLCEIGLVIKKSCDESELFTVIKDKIVINKSTNFVQDCTLVFGPKKAAEVYSEKDYTIDFEGMITGVKVWNDTLSTRDMFIHAKDILSTSRENYTSDLKYYNDIQDALSVYCSFEEINENSSIGNYYDVFNHNNNSTFNSNFVLRGEVVEVTDCFTSLEHSVLEQNYLIDYPANYKKINIASFEENKEYNHNKYDSIRAFNSKELTSYNNKRQINIDFSSVKLLNEDINRTIDAYDFFTEAVINSTSRFDFDYNLVNNIRRKYFERLETEINYKQLYQVFVYFENIMSEILMSLVPQNVNYSGFKYVVESHILERNKYQYKMGESRLPAWQRSSNHNYYQENKSSSEFGRIIK